ncbi:MAG: cobalamin-dependent protein [Bryobacterales bacterium]|nr:cobalamin-dependent protein [Bryobacterales bacterium]
MGQIPASGRVLYETYGPLLAAKMSLRLAREGMLGDHRHHTKFVHACLKLGSYRCLVEVMDWAYQSWVARGLEARELERELGCWKEVVEETVVNRAGGQELVRLYEVLWQADETFRARVEKARGPLGEQALPRPARELLSALLTGDEVRAAGTPMELGESMRLLPQWWENIVAPAMRTVGKLWSEGCVTVVEEHVATGIAQELLRSRFPAAVQCSMDEVVAVVVPEGELHTMGAEIVRDFLRLKGYKVFYTGADTPMDGLLRLLEHNAVSFLLISTTMAAPLVSVMDLIDAVNERMGERRPRIVVGGQAYLLDGRLWEKVGADVCLHGLEELGAYMRADAAVELAGGRLR